MSGRASITVRRRSSEPSKSGIRTSIPIHGLIERIPHTHRYRVTDLGLRHALFLTRAHTRLLRTGLAEIHGPPVPTKLRAAATAYEHAINDLARAAQLAA